MSTLNKCKVVMLPTEKATGIFKEIMNLFGEPKNGILEFTTNQTLIRNNHLISNRKAATNTLNKYIFYDFYILSDDEIKEGDWCINIKTQCLLQVAGISNNISDYEGINMIIQKHELTHHCLDDCKKIIATTDTSLGRYWKLNEVIPLPQPSQSFIEKYVEEYNKGNVITEVLVEYEEVWIPSTSTYGHGEYDYKLKVNPKDNTITIKKVKDSWSREEIIELLEKLKPVNSLSESIARNKWIKENL